MNSVSKVTKSDTYPGKIHAWLQAKEKFSVFVNRNIRVGTSFQALVMAKCTTVNNLFIEDTIGMTEVSTLNDQFSRLSTENIGETDLHLDDAYLAALEKLGFIDTHDQQRVPQLRVSDVRTDQEGATIVNRLGRLDATHCNNPLFVELKPITTGPENWEGLFHILERTDGVSAFHGTLKRVVAITTNGSELGNWMVEAVREPNSLTIETGCIYFEIHRIQLSDVAGYVKCLTMQPSDYYYGDDHVSMKNLLTKFGVDWMKACIHLKAVSTSNVYTVDVSLNNSSVMASTNTLSFAVKVNSNESRATAEMAALTKISAEYAKKGESHYSVAFTTDILNSEVVFLGRQEDSLRLHLEENVKKLTPSRSTVETKREWNPSLTASGKVMLIMHTGEQVIWPSVVPGQDEAHQTDYKRLKRDVKSDLKTIHLAGILHTDIRRLCNILKFQSLDRYHIIDFDLSVAKENGMNSALVIMLKGTEQFNHAPGRIRERFSHVRHDENVEICWSEEDDSDMFEEYLEAKLIQMIYDKKLRSGLNIK